MMSVGRDILLTGGTGFLGRYLLRDLLASGRRVIALVRDYQGTPAAERLAGLTALWADALDRALPRPLVLGGELGRGGLGLSPVDRQWLAGRCGAVVHAAAHVAFRRSDAGEPWATNVDGTRQLVELCASAGLSEFHHVSTAFVCGERTGTVYEDELDRGQRFHNDYEHSKFEAERLVRGTPGIRPSVYRPSVIVGDSRTGYAGGYHGLYRFLELADRLATAAAGRGMSSPGQRFLPLRLPWTGAEAHNLVPVDWVSEAIVRLVNQSADHGRTYHLVADRPVRMGEIKEVAEEVLGIDGVSWAGPDGLGSADALEQTFLEYVRAYWPYLHGDPLFDCRNTRAALPALPPPTVDRPMLARLIRFARAARWGRQR